MDSTSNSLPGYVFQLGAKIDFEEHTRKVFAVLIWVCIAAVGGNLEWSLSYLIWQKIQQSGSRATLQERNKGGDAVGEDDKGKTESVSEQ